MHRNFDKSPGGRRSGVVARAASSRLRRGRAPAAGSDEKKDLCPVSAHDTIEPTRRDFLYIATGMAGAVGAAAVAWPFIDQMRPDASTLALASIEVDVSAAAAGHVADGQMARQAGVHPQPHARGDRGGQGGRRSPTSRTRSRATPTCQPTRRRPTPTAPPARARRTGWSWSASAPISAAFRSASRAISAAGSAPATARTTIRPAASAKARRRRTLPSRRSRSCPTPTIRIG